MILRAVLAVALALGVVAAPLFAGAQETGRKARVGLPLLPSRARLPAIYAFRQFVDVGGLMSYGPNLPDSFRQSAVYVDKILKGARPAESPNRLHAPRGAAPTGRAKGG
jgi:hypothetical protein